MILKITRSLNLFLLATISLISCKDSNVLIKQDTAEVTYSTDSTTVQFEGLITAVKNDCWADGTCSIEVNHKWWIEIQYGLREESSIPKERGQSAGIRFTSHNECLGKKVKVYAEIIETNNLTLEGDNSYYVEIVKQKS